MKWQHAGERAPDNHSDGELIEQSDDTYVRYHGYLVPWYPPPEGETERAQREILNIELCDRVFRLSDLRPVARNMQEADAAINSLQQRFEQDGIAAGRGTGRTLFARITSQIRSLSEAWLQTGDEAMLERISGLYRYVMVDHRELFECIRLYDHSVDEDGIIEEIFSEIGKPQTTSLAMIYSGRARKIGAAMDGIARTYDAMMDQMHNHPFSDEFLMLLDHYHQAAKYISGIATTDHVPYDRAVALYIDMLDEVRDRLWLMHNARESEESVALCTYLQQGVSLIDSMRNIRDVRTNSLKAFSKG